MNDDNSVLLQLAFSEVAPDPDQPRKFLDPKGIEELASSMKAQGQIQAISVRTNPAYEFDKTAAKYLIVAGERRWTAGQEAGLPYIEAVLKNIKNVAAAQLIENIDREKLNPVELAEALTRRISELEEQGVNSPKSEVAKEHGKSNAWVSKALKIMELDPEIRELARNGSVRDIDILKKLNKCRSAKRNEAFLLIEKGEFNAKEFFKRKRSTKTEEGSLQESGEINSNSDSSNQNKKTKYNVKRSTYNALVNHPAFASVRESLDEDLEPAIEKVVLWLDKLVEEGVVPIRQ